MIIPDYLKELLDWLEEHIKPEKIEASLDLNRRALQWESVPRLPLTFECASFHEARFTPFPHGETFNNPSKHLYNELVSSFGVGITGNIDIDCDYSLSIRANLGLGLVAGILGGKVEQIGNNPPWVRSFETEKEFRAIFDHDPTNVLCGWLPQVIDLYHYFDLVFEPYPILNKYIIRVLPDLQGPFDNYDLLRGSEAYIDFYNNKKLLRDGLKHVTQVQLTVAKMLSKLVSNSTDNYQHGVMIKGNILIRSDSGIMVSPKMYKDIVSPFDSMLLTEMKGGGIHSCGNIMNHADTFLSTTGIMSLDMGQAMMNNRDELYSKAKRLKIPLIRMEASKDELASGDICNRFPTGVNLVYRYSSSTEIKEVWSSYVRRYQM